MAVHGYILQGWGDKGLWVLSNAIWDTWAGYDAMKITAEGGYGEREFDDIYNKNWQFIINFVVTLGETLRADVLFFLEGDSKPIIFRYDYNVPDDYITFYIIYDGNVKDSKVIDVYGDYIYKIYRIGTIYHFTNLGISFDYGLVKKPVKLKLTGTLLYDNRMWWLGQLYDEYILKWYYTEPTSEITEGYAFIM